MHLRHIARKHSQINIKNADYTSRFVNEHNTHYNTH